MISQSDVHKLLALGCAEPEVLSLYLRVPVDPAALRGLPARANELLKHAEDSHATGSVAAPGGAGRVSDEDRQWVHQVLGLHAREWLGHTVAIFACRRLSLSQAIELPCELEDRAVLAARPHVRPLLAALQRCPAHYVVVVDHRNAWVLRVAGELIDTLAQPAGEALRSRGFGGWHGLEAHRIHQRVRQLAHHHYQDTARALERAMHVSGPGPLVIGGHKDGIPAFLAVLGEPIRARFAGSFATDPHTITPARARAFAQPVIQRWETEREQRLVSELAGEPPGAVAVSGLAACLAAVNQRAVRLLMVPAGGLIPGFACQRCGKLSSTGSGCRACGAATLAVPDLIEEMVAAVLGDGGQVETAAEPPAGVAARLRFPLAPERK